VAQGGDGAGFDLEALAARRIGRDFRRQDLQGDVAVQPRIAGPIDLAHAAGPKCGEHFVGTEPRAGGQGHVEGDSRSTGWPGQVERGARPMVGVD
jgi:hypothetical protein